MENSNKIQEIRKYIDSKGGVMNWNSNVRRGRILGRPMRINLINELKELSTAELNIAFYCRLIGNNGHSGTIIKNAKK